MKLNHVRKIVGMSLMAGIVAAGVGAAQAHDGKGPHAGAIMLKKLDANGDGVITREEFAAGKGKRFARLDADGNGKVTVAEIDSAVAKKLERKKYRLRYRMLSRLDADGDGVITADEFRKAQMQRFNRADLDGDGRLDKKEIATLKRRMAMMRAGQMKRMRKMMMRMMNRMMNQGGMMNDSGMPGGMPDGMPGGMMKGEGAGPAH